MEPEWAEARVRAHCCLVWCLEAEELSSSCLLPVQDNPASRRVGDQGPGFSALQHGSNPSPTDRLDQSLCSALQSAPRAGSCRHYKAQGMADIHFAPSAQPEQPWHQPSLAVHQLGQAGEGCCCRRVKSSQSGYTNLNSWCPLLPMKSHCLWKSVLPQGRHSSSPAPSPGHTHTPSHWREVPILRKLLTAPQPLF